MTGANQRVRTSRSREIETMRREPSEVSRSERRPTGRVDAPFDPVTLAAAAVVLGMGIVLVYSSSSMYAARLYGDAEHFLKQQLVAVGIGLAGLLIAARFPAEWLRRQAALAFGVAVVLCGVVLIPGVGHLAGGARRWLNLPGLGFQPSELAKLAVVLLLAAILARPDERPLANQRPFVLPVLLAQIPVLLILAEPDLGTALVIELILAVMVFTAGLRLRTLAFLALAALPILYHQVVGTDFRRLRLLSYIDPWAYRSTVGYQITEALISLGSGGITGVGLGESKHKLFFLPEAHTDFIFAILGEELGSIGVLVLLAAFGVLIWRGVRAALRSSSSFDGYLAVGLTALVGVPAVFNVCVATGMLPTKGLPLPLVSYGGSNLVTTLIAVGLLLRIERQGRAAGGAR